MNEEKNEKVEEEEKEEEVVIEKKSKILAWLRLGVFSLFFYIFFFFAVVLLNFLPTDDIYQLTIDVFRATMFKPIMDIYAFIVPPNLWHNEAAYITVSLILVFFITGFLCGDDNFKNFLFKGSAIKRFGAQVLIFFGFLISFLRIFTVLPQYFFNILTPIFFLLGAAIVWLIYQTVALYRYSRKYASSAESFLLRHNNKFTHSLAVTATFWGLLAIGIVGYGYLLFIDILSLYGVQLIFGIRIDQWQLYTLIFGGALVFICLTAFFISVFSKKNKRERLYDNFSIVISNLSLWPYILLNLAMYFIFSSGISGSKNVGIEMIFASIDLIISIIILFLTLRGMGTKTDWKFGIIRRESFILTIYGAISGYYGIKYLLFRQQLVPVNPGDLFSVNILYELLIGIPIQPIIPPDNFYYFILLPSFPLNPYYNTFLITPGLEFIVNSGNIITSVAVIILLLGALITYGIHREKFGEKFRIHEVGAKEGRATTDFIYDFMKKEYYRRKEPFPLYEVEKLISNSIELDKEKTIELINKTDIKYKDLKIDGNKKRYVYFD
ncbi:MAG: hypothetical protein ACTSRG_17310 [Candidatus Helarchaeota archaeon]